MKLRRALATAAATAALAPIALLSAPAAFAEGTPSDTTGTTTTESTSNPSDASSSPAATDTPAPGATGSTEPAPTGTSSTPAEPETTPPTTAPEETTTQSPSPTGTPDPTNSATEEPEAPEPDVPFCEDLDEEYDDAKVSADITGLPGKIVAGSGYHSFQLVVTNDSDVDVKEVAVYATVDNYELDDIDKYLSRYVDLQFKDPDNGKWTSIGEDGWAGGYFAYAEELKSKASEKFDLRVSVDKDAPAGDAYSLGAGAYLDKVGDQDCVASGWGFYEFQVLKPGSANPNPGDATPGDKDGKDPVKRPQGDIADLPIGNLAETGSSSALPMIGLIGGAAVVVGGGAVFLVRRRKGAESSVA